MKTKNIVLTAVYGFLLVGLGLTIWWRVRLPALELIPSGRVEEEEVVDEQGALIAEYNPFQEQVVHADEGRRRITRIPQAYPGWYAARLPILMYHTVRPLTADMNTTTRRLTTTPETFEAQLKFLQENNFNTMFLSAAMQLIGENKKLPPRTVVLTFDDGTRDFYHTVLPLLLKYKQRAVAFVNPDITTNPRFMTAAMIKDCAASGLVEIGSHASTHPFLVDLDGESETLQIAESKQKLELIVGQPVVSFSYPFGAFSTETLKKVEAAGYANATTAYYGQVAANRFRLQLPRILVGEDEKIEGFAAKIGGG